MSIGTSATIIICLAVLLIFQAVSHRLDMMKYESLGSRLDTLTTVYRELSDTLNPVGNSMVDYESSEEKDVADVELAMEREIEENIALNERVARLKEEIADRHVNTYTPQPPLTLHPDVYNIPDAKLPDTDHMVEYAE